MEEALEERHHDQVDQQQREGEGEPRGRKVRLAHPGPAVEAPLVAGRQRDVGELLLHLPHHAEGSPRNRGVGADGEFGTAVFPFDAAGPAHHLEVRHGADRDRGAAHHDGHAADVIQPLTLLLGVLDHDVHLPLVALDGARRTRGQGAADRLGHREGPRPGGERPLGVGGDVEFFGAALERGVHVPDPGEGAQPFHHPAGDQFEDVHVVALQVQPDAAAAPGTPAPALGDPEIHAGDGGQHLPDLVGDLLNAPLRLHFVNQVQLEPTAAAAETAAPRAAAAAPELIDHVGDLELLAPLFDERRHRVHDLTRLVNGEGPGHVHVDGHLAFDGAVEAGTLGVLVEDPGHSQQADRHQERDEAVLERAADDLSVEAAEQAHGPRIDPPFVPEHDARHHRHHGERHQERGHDHHAEGEPEVREDPEEAAHRGPEEDERHEHAHGGRRPRDDRHGDRRGAVDRRGAGVFLVLGEMT